MLKSAFPAIVSAAFFLIPCIASATDRFFADQAVFSPDRRYKLEAKSPDNANKKQERKAFQQNFVFTLSDTRTKKIIWSGKQGVASDCSSSLDFNNDGWSVLINGRRWL